MFSFFVKLLGKLVSFITFASYLLLLSSPLHFANANVRIQPRSTSNADKGSSKSDPLVEKALRSLSIKQKVGQLFIFGFTGETLSAGLSETLKAQQPGGIIVFGRNIRSARQLADLNYSAQSLARKISKVPLFIAVDQEGGSVIRVKTPSPLPSALALGATKRKDLAFAAGSATGKMLRTLGFTMNLAPVLDVSDPSDPTFIGTRTFGKDPKLVANLGGSFAEGLQTQGIVPTAKHFPGHGGVSEDSHELTPEKDSSLSELLRSDLLPFSQMAQAKTPWALMLAHISFPKLDPSGLPATFSKPIVTDILRKRLGYDGVVMTDDIEMGGATGIKSIGERAIRAIDAGADLVMIAWNRKSQAEAVEAVNKAVVSGKLSVERIDESVRRLLLAKRQLLTAPIRKAPSNSVLLASLKNIELKKISELTIQQRLTEAARELDHDFAVEAAERPLYIFSSSNAFVQSFRKGLPRKRVIPIFLGKSAVDLNQILRANTQALGVFYLSGPRSAQFANQLATDVTDRVIIINTETTGLLDNPDAFRQIVDIHFRHPDLGKMTAQHFFVPKTEEVLVRVPARSTE